VDVHARATRDGLSDRQPGRNLLELARRRRRVCRCLGLDRFAVVGFSAGAPYALACDHSLADRVVVVGMVCGGIAGVHEPVLTGYSGPICGRRFSDTAPSPTDSLPKSSRNFNRGTQRGPEISRASSTSGSDWLAMKLYSARFG
jgi:pimeloyl-ACP methyl ester carboxylesterase